MTSSGNRSDLTCDCCGAAIDAQPHERERDAVDVYCRTCAASSAGFEEGRRVAALLAISDAIDRALEGGCTLEHIRQAVDYVRDPANREAPIPGYARNVDSEDWAIAIANGTDPNPNRA
jgi:hypothetical protein